MARTAQAAAQTEANEADDELTIVGDHEDSTEEQQADDERAGGAQQAEQDERVGGGEAAEQSAEDEKERRRQKRLRKKERARTEMNFLRSRNEQLERRFSETAERITGTEVATIDTRIQEVDRNLRIADEALAKAIESTEAGRGQDIVKLQGYRDELRDAKGQLLQAKQQTTQRQEQVRNAPAPPDPEMLSRAREFKERNPWFDFGLSDAKSRLVKRIDDALAAEGLYTANTQEYWDELEARLARRPELSGHFKDRETVNDEDDEDEDEDDEATPPARRAEPAKNGKNGGPKFTSGGRERPLRKNEVYVNKERREAMEELGVWDDPTLRKKYLASYAKYDREHPSAREH
jgi:hypothetical protein